LIARCQQDERKDEETRGKTRRREERRGDEETRGKTRRRGDKRKDEETRRREEAVPLGSGRRGGRTTFLCRTYIFIFFLDAGVHVCAWP